MEDFVILQCGKYKGKTWKYVYDNDKSYCNWLITKAENGGERGSMHCFAIWLKSKFNVPTLDQLKITKIKNPEEKEKLQRQIEVFNSIHVCKTIEKYVNLFKNYPELSNLKVYTQSAFYIKTDYNILNFHTQGAKLNLAQNDAINIELYDEPKIMNNDNVIIGRVNSEIEEYVSVHLLGVSYCDYKDHENHRYCCLVADEFPCECLLCGYKYGSSAVWKLCKFEFATDYVKRYFNLHK